jgi:hypothetical protein
LVPVVALATLALQASLPSSILIGKARDGVAR